MIAKGNQRSGGQSLATHLMNSYDNERVEIAEVRGAIAQDLHGAFAEWFAQSKGTRCKEYLYSLSVNPDGAQGNLNRQQYLDFVRRAEDRLGLTNQPRALVFHTKNGRAHCHVVWSRIDLEKMKAVQLSNDRQKLRSVAQDFARDHGLTLPEGMKRNRARDRFNEAAKRVSLAEKQQEDRTGESKAARVAAIMQAWRQSDNGRAFVHALQARGYYIAQGDKRAYVVVDRWGEVHSLSRQLQGVRAKALQARLADYPLAKMPRIEAARDFARRQREDMARARTERAKEAQAKRAPERPKGPTPPQRRENLRRTQKARRDALDARRDELRRRHAAESEALKEMQRAHDTGVMTDRLRRQPKGLSAFLRRITGIQMLIDVRRRRQDEERARAQRRQTEALQRRHEREQQEIERRYHALAAVEKREARSLEIAMHRERFRAIAAGREPQERAPQKAPALTPKQQERADALERNARDITAPRTQAPAAKEKEGGKPKARGRLSRLFNQVSEMFAHHGTESGGRGKERKEPEAGRPERPRDAFDKAADPERTAPDAPAAERDAPSAGGLSETFNRSVAPEKKTESGQEKGPRRPRRRDGMDRGR